MRIRTSVLAWPLLALAGLVVAAPAAHASHYGPVTKRFGIGIFREVHRPAYGPVVVGPTFGVPAVGVTQQSVQLAAVAPQAFSLQTIAPQSFQLQTVAPQSFQIVPQNTLLNTGGLSGAEAQSGGLRSPGATGGASGAGTTTTTTTTVCPELVGRLDKIEGRLGKLEDRLTDIEKKVDSLVAERQVQLLRAERAEELRQLESRITVNVTTQVAQVLANQQGALNELITELGKPEAQRNLKGIQDKYFKKP